MESASRNLTRTTAYGAADAPALGTQGAGGKWTTGHGVTAYGTADAPALGTQGAGEK